MDLLEEEESFKELDSQVSENNEFHHLMNRIIEKYQTTGAQRSCDSEYHEGEKEFHILSNENIKYCCITKDNEELREYFPDSGEYTATIDICDKCLEKEHKVNLKKYAQTGKEIINKLINEELKNKNSSIYKIIVTMYYTEEMNKKLNNETYNVSDIIFDELKCIY